MLRSKEQRRKVRRGATRERASTRATPITSLSTAHLRLARAPASVSSSLARPVIDITPFTFFNEIPTAPVRRRSHAEPLGILLQCAQADNEFQPWADCSGLALVLPL